MFKSKIVFIIGAGASKEVDLPVGRALAGLIAQKMNVQWNSIGHLTGGGDIDLLRLMLRVEPKVHPDQWQKAAHRLRDGLPLSKSPTGDGSFAAVIGHQPNGELSPSNCHSANIPAKPSPFRGDTALVHAWAM